MDEKLNNEAENQKYGAMWTFDLELSNNYVNVIAGKPVNGQLFVDAVNPLGRLVDLCIMFMNGCTIVEQQTKEPIIEPSSITDGIMVSFCFNVSVDGFTTPSFVELDTQLKDVDGLSSYFNERYEVVDADDQTVVYKPTFVVNRDMRLFVVKKHRVTFGKPISNSYYVHPGGTLDDIQNEHGVKLDDFIVKISGSGTVLTKTSTIDADIELILCHSVTVSGVFNGSFLVEHDTQLKDVSNITHFFNKNYIMTSEQSVLNETSRVEKDISIIIKAVKTIQVVISFDDSDDVTDESVKDAIDGVAGSVVSNPSFVEVVSEGENSFIISITATDDDMNNLVNALKNCSSTDS